MNEDWTEDELHPWDPFLDEIDPDRPRPHRDFEGNPIPLRVWMKLLDDPRRIIAQDHVGEFFISTVWIGLDHGWGGPPLIFETMVFHEKGERPFHDVDCWRYSTWDEAVAGHATHLEELRLVLDWSE